MVNSGNWGPAVNAAINAALSLGTNNVIWPAGTYNASGITLKSGITLEAQGVVNVSHPNGTDGTHIFTTEEISTTGTIAASSNQLTVPNGALFHAGERLSIRGAGGTSVYQFGTLSADIASNATSLSLTKVINDSVFALDGWAASTTYIWIDNELLSYGAHTDSALSFTSLQRGLYGTTAAAHSAGATVSLALALYAQVVSVAGNVVTLDTTAIKAVTSAVVQRGSQNITVRGLTMDGLKPVAVQGAKSHGVEIGHGRNITIENTAFNHFAHSGVNADRGSQLITERNCSFTDCGYTALPEGNIGAGSWAFRGAQLITDTCAFTDCNIGIYWDDRTSKATEFDRSSDNCQVSSSTFNGGWCGIQDNGGSNESITGCTFDGNYRGVLLIAGWQGTQAVPNDTIAVTGNIFRDLHSGIYVALLTTNVTYAPNTFENCDSDVVLA